MVGGAIHQDLTLIDSSDDDAPFIVPRSAASPARPSRRLVLVPGSVEANPQSIQDRGGVETPHTQQDIVPCSGLKDGARVAVCAESFGGLSTIPATPSALHARGVELPQPVFNSGRFAVLSEDTDDDETQSVGTPSGEEEVVEAPVEVLPEGPEPSVAATRAGFVSLDAVNVEEMFQRRGCVMKTVPYFLQYLFRTVLRIVLRQIQSIDMVERERGWKLFLLAPRMLLHRLPRGGLINKEKLASRFSKFARGEWMDLVNMGARCAEEASATFRRKRRRGRDPDGSQAARALQLNLGSSLRPERPLRGPSSHLATS